MFEEIKVASRRLQTQGRSHRMAKIASRETDTQTNFATIPALEDDMQTEENLQLGSAPNSPLLDPTFQLQLIS